MQVATQFRVGNARLDRGLLAAACLGSGGLTVRGMWLEASNLAEMLWSVLAGIMITIFMFLYWRWLIDRLANSESMTGRALAAATLVLWLPIMFFSSTTYNASAINGNAARETEMHRHVEQAGRHAARVYEQAGLIRAVATDIELEAGLYRSAAQAEKTAGKYSRRPGKGAVSDTLGNIAGRIEELQATITEHLKQARAQADKAQGHLAAMREALAADKPVAWRMKTLARRSDQLRRNLTDLGGADIAGTVQRALEALPAIAEGQLKLSAHRGTAAGQRRALDMIRSDLARTSGVLSRSVAALPRGAPDSYPTLAQVSAYRAIALHWEQYISTWVASMAMDLCPLAIAVFLLLSVSEKTREQLVWERVLQVTAEQQIYGQFAKEVRNSVAMLPESLEGLNREIQGKADKSDARDLSIPD